MTPQELKDRMSHNPIMDSFNSKFGDKLRDEYLLTVMREAEQQVLVDTKGRVKEVDVTPTAAQVTAGIRAINLETDFLIPYDFRWIDPNDPATIEGIPIKILNKDKFL